MPNATTIAINDGQTTPTTHTFSLTEFRGRKAVFENRNAPFPGAFEKLEIEVVRAQSASGGNRVLVTMQRPVTAVVNGRTQVVRFSKVELFLNSGNEAPEAERNDDVALIKNLCNNTSFIDCVKKLEQYYG